MPRALPTKGLPLPPKEKLSLAVPSGLYTALRRPGQKIDWTDEFEDRLFDEVVACYGILHRACLRLGLNYNTVRDHIQDRPHLKEKYQFAKHIFTKEVEYQYLDRVIDPNERNPAWKIYWMKNQHPEYLDKKGVAPSIVVNISDDSTKKIDVIEGSVVRAQLAETNEDRIGPDEAVDSASDPAGSP